jgi:DNA-directed RNA polymerase specialized sigma subunit
MPRFLPKPPHEPLHGNGNKLRYDIGRNSENAELEAHELILLLPEVMQRIVRLRHLEERSLREIAVIFSWSETKVARVDREAIRLMAKRVA